MNKRLYHHVVTLLLLALSCKSMAKQRIISLAPHLTEWVYSLDMGNSLVAASDYSDYPEQAKTLVRVADYQGVDFSAIAALNPTLILAWEGGNRPQDIARLQTLGFAVFNSRIDSPEDIASELRRLGKRLDKSEHADRLAESFLSRLTAIKTQYQNASPLRAFYYSWTKPLMTVGANTWANKLLNVCNATTVFTDSPVDYPQVSIQQVLKRQPDIIVAAQKATYDALAAFWQPHEAFLTAPLVKVNPDVTSRFTLRLIPELTVLCSAMHSALASDTAITLTPSEALLERAAQHNWLIVDVRSPEEYHSGHIPTAKNIPLQTLQDADFGLLPSREQPIVVYCRTGRRANKAVNILAAQGFQTLYLIEGDIERWKADALPLSVSEP